MISFLVKIFSNKLFLVFLGCLFISPAKALELKVESQIYSSHPGYFTGADLFKMSLPNALVAELEKSIEKVRIESGKNLTYKREVIRKLLWKAIQKYRQASGEKLQIILPEKVEVFSFKDRLNLENLKSRVQLIAKSECPSCQVEVELKNNIDLNYVGIWEVETTDDNWKGEVELILRTDRLDKVPAVIRWKDQVVVAKHSIHAGDPVREKDLKLMKKDVTFLGKPYVNRKDKIVNRISRRNFRVNQVISESATKRANVIRYGESVSLHFVDDVFSVTANAQAKGAGAIGDRIPIYIPRTKKKMMAKIIEKGKVRIE